MSRQQVTSWEEIAELPPRKDKPFIDEMEEIMQSDIKNGIIEKNKEWLKNNSAYL